MPSVGCVGVKPVVFKGFSGGCSLLVTRLPGYTSCGTCMTSIVAENRTIGSLLSMLCMTFNGLLGRRSPARCEQTSIDVFLEKITAKISSIRDATATAPPPAHLPTSHRLSSLREVTSAELRMFILAAAPKTCELGPMPTFLVQDYVDVLLPFLTMMCNCSIRQAQLPSSQKRSILHPVLKREGLDQTDPGNYRPIANVSFISKILERIIASQLVAYSDAYD